MKKLTVVIGGVYSGKTLFGANLALDNALDGNGSVDVFYFNDEHIPAILKEPTSSTLSYYLTNLNDIGEVTKDVINQRVMAGESISVIVDGSMSDDDIVKLLSDITALEESVGFTVVSLTLILNGKIRYPTVSEHVGSIDWVERGRLFGVLNGLNNLLPGRIDEFVVTCTINGLWGSYKIDPKNIATLAPA